MANTTTTMTIHWKNGVSIIHAGTPLDTNGYPVMDDTAVGIVAEDVQMPDKTATVITAGEWDEIVNEAYFHIADAVKLKLSDITFTPPPASGGSGDPGVFAFDIVPDETAGIALSATWQELHDAIEDNKFCVGFIDSSSSDDFSKSSFIVVSVQTDSTSDQPYMVSLFAGEQLTFATDTADGHPGLVQNGGQVDDLQNG